MSLSLADITAVVDEIRPAVVGGWIQKIHQPAPRTVTLEIRTRGRTLTLLLSADSVTGRLHVTGRRVPNPPSPPPFCQFLRSHVQGARIEAVEQLHVDRIVRFALATRDRAVSLVAMLTGRSADLLVLDHRETVLASLTTGHTVGLPFAVPAPRPRSPLASATPRVPDDTGSTFPVSETLEARYGAEEERQVSDRWRAARLAHLRKAIKKIGRRVEALQTDLQHAERYRDYARYGELLKANLRTIRKGDAEVTVTDYFDAAMPELTLPLDAAKTPQGNMADYFRKHRKCLAADREVRPRLAETERELARLTEERAAVERGDLTGTPLPIAPPADRPSPRRSGPFRRFVSADGVPIFVGRNARENEELTFGLARGNDLWLHAHGTPGSHVVIRLEKGAVPPPETLRDAATLALLYSDLKKAGKGDVIYTRGKYVKRVKGKSAGTVTVTREKSLFVTLDRARQERLKRDAL